MTAADRVPAALVLLLLALGLAAAVALTTPWTPLRGPVPGGRVAVDVRRDFTAAEVAHEDAFHRAVRPPAYAALAVGLALALLLGLTPLGSRLIAAVARPLGGGWGWQVALGGLALTLLGWLLVLPLRARSEVVLRHYGLSTQSWGSWLLDGVKGLGLQAVLLTAVLLGAYAVIRALPRLWWLPLAAAAAALVVLLSFVWPLVVEPVFNKFTPMPDGALRSSLLALAREDGVPVRDVLVADASRRTTALNAYVSGFGGTRRIVVYDTLLATATPAEVRLVVAHELGHAKRQDVLHGTLEGALGAAAGVVALSLLLSWAPLLRQARVSSAGDPRGLALVLALLTLLGTLAGPVQLLVSRRIEARADVHSLDLTRDPATFISSERTLALRNLSDLDPPPLLYGLFASHPTAPERIALARTWERAR